MLKCFPSGETCENNIFTSSYSMSWGVFLWLPGAVSNCYRYVNAIISDILNMFGGVVAVFDPQLCRYIQAIFN